ncbi:uncharacterized protein J4E92_001350 [Alternaria infectoria]|uniref:uncharacterized protein n=1 Tax=Alternaria infectoria TaxID=45303 RepID=UPI00221F0E00|nr:uncharacterized protein J4E92_001350 [Alternaria infectoria]KAI4940062.1 hypothetical protein J4E92_001350 [Alternaria infectoria]
MFSQPRITKFVDSLRKVPEGESIEQLKLNDYLQPWGFTIYRTYYGPGSNEQWDKLLQNITTGVKNRLKASGGSNEDPAMIVKAEELFKLIVIRGARWCIKDVFYTFIPSSTTPTPFQKFIIKNIYST